MKKILSLMLCSIIVAISLASCNIVNSTTQTTNTPAETINSTAGNTTNRPFATSGTSSTTITSNTASTTNITTNANVTTGSVIIPNLNVVLENSRYSILSGEGKNYFVFNSVGSSVTGGSMVTATVIFNSLSEMKNAILNNSLTDEQLSIIYHFPKDANGIKILDINNLYTPKLINDFESSKVTWGGETYSFVMYSETSVTDMYITFMCLTPKSYEKTFSDYENFTENPLLNITKTEEISDRNATVIYYTTSTAKLKSIFYEIEVNGTKLAIEEEYLLEFKSGSLEVSETVPSRIMVYGKNEVEGTYFHAVAYQLNERPSLEWFNSFVLEKFED